MMWLIFALGFLLQDKPEKPKRIEAAARPCFGSDQVPGSEYNAFWLDLNNVSKEDLALTCTFQSLVGAAKLTQKLTLPRGSSQRLFAYLPPSSGFGNNSNVQVKVTDAAGEVLYDNEVIAHSMGDAKAMKLLALFDESMSINTFMLPPEIRRVPIVKTSCEPRNFPDSWIGLHGFHVILLYRYDFTKLRPEQQQALKDWVFAGGRLVVIPSHDPNSVKAPPLDELLPFQVSGPENINDHAALNRFFELTGNVAPYPFYPVRGPEHLTFQDPKGPLLVWQERGLGRVYLVAFDLLKDSFARNREAFMLEILSLAADNVGPSRDVALNRLQAVNRIVVPPPPIGMVLLIVVAFVVIVGPLNYIVLFQRKRPIFSVITIPVISIAFAVLVLVLGLVLRSGHRMAHNVVLLQTRSGDPAGYEMRLLSLLSPNSRAYDFEFQGQTFLHTPSLAEQMTRDGAYDLSIEKLADGMALRGIRLQRFEGRQYYAHGVRSLGGGVQVRRENNTLFLKNLSPYALRRGVFLSHDGKYYEVDDLKPGIEKTVELSATTLLPKPVAYLGGSDPAALEAAGSLLSAKGPQALYLLLDRDLGTVNVQGLPGAGTNDFVVLKVQLDR